MVVYYFSWHKNKYEQEGHMKNQYITWVVVLDAQQARLFMKGAQGNLEAIGYPMYAEPVRTNPDSRHSLGRTFNSNGGNIRHIIEPHTPEWTQECKEFIKHVVEYLEASLWEYDRLIIAAPPKMLGFFRKALSKPVQDKVILELNKDFIHLQSQQIQKRLKSLINIF